MASQTYSARDLLRMRNVPVQRELSSRLQNKLQMDSDLGEVVRVSSDRSLPLIEEDPKELLEDETDLNSSQHTLSRQLDGTDSEWRYRGRTTSEQDEVQPISAPSTLSAQKDEGFQRFYKAVVSPTHIRVTAGGRIVPNTRASSSPTSKWAKDKGIEDPLARSFNREPPAYSAFPAQQPSFGPFPPMLPGFFPTIPPGHASYSLVPWPMGLAFGGAFSMPPPSPAQVSPASNAGMNMGEAANSDKTAEYKPVENPRALPLSFPDQFDPSRPFLYNGQWVMHPGGQLYPYGVPPMHAFQTTPGLPGPAMVPQGYFAHPSLAMNPPKDHQPVPAPPQHELPASATSPASLSPSYKPIVSSIRPSDITKKQVDVLRGSLKYLEDQLQYNKHQIDEKVMESQAQMVRQQIQQFEKNLENQLNFEKDNYPSKDNTTSSRVSHDEAQSKSAAADDIKPELRTSQNSSASPGETVTSRRSKPRTNIDNPTSRFSLGNSSTKSVCAFPLGKFSPDVVEYAEPTKKITALPVTAALAPPFQPYIQSPTSHSAGNATITGNSQQDTQQEASMQDQLVSKPHIPKTGTGSHPMNHFGESRKPVPYLVGQTPTGNGPSGTRYADYAYNRELTEDELRARHMYWGMAPAHLQKGLPKFDGKDFYPPSPTKESSRAYNGNPRSSGQSLTNDEGTDGIAAPKYKPEAESCQWFRPIPRSKRHDFVNATQSETIPRVEHSFTSRTDRSDSSIAPATDTYDTCRKTTIPKVQVSISSDSKGLSSSSDGDDDKTLLFKGRKTMGRNGTKTHNEIWQSVLRKGRTSAIATPGTVSSTTVQGVLPNYAGHATASLTPAIANASPRSNKSKASDFGHDERANTTLETKRENMPPKNQNLRHSLRRGNRPGNGREGMVSH